MRIRPTRARLFTSDLFQEDSIGGSLTHAIASRGLCDQELERASSSVRIKPYRRLYIQSEGASWVTGCQAAQKVFFKLIHPAALSGLGSDRGKAAPLQRRDGLAPRADLLAHLATLLEDVILHVCSLAGLCRPVNPPS
ncbi:hypothetical protein WJX84_002991 [Apatococcus fuscideae]|uniref:Uncharacterized protein n=1 Tax=Apatococcus fuscideae TaxID=2026836 RepID=A0AAW1T7S0_9CHLO